jgi:hypothetical protein
MAADEFPCLRSDDVFLPGEVRIVRSSIMGFVRARATLMISTGLIKDCRSAVAKRDDTWASISTFRGRKTCDGGRLLMPGETAFSLVRDGMAFNLAMRE